MCLDFKKDFLDLKNNWGTDNCQKKKTVKESIHASVFKLNAVIKYWLLSI